MLLKELTRHRVHDNLREVERLEAEIRRLLVATKGAITPDFPPTNIWISKSEVILTVEVPGIDPSDVDISLQGTTLELWGCRQPDELKDNQKYRRRERDYGQFHRLIDLPARVDQSNVEAKFSNGILLIRLQRAEADKPQKIAVERA